MTAFKLFGLILSGLWAFALLIAYALDFRDDERSEDE